MSLFKQMALAISFIIIVLLSSVMMINYHSSKKEMIQSLYETTVNNISSLAGKLAESANNPVLMRTIIDSEFDSGYFKNITFIANDGSFRYIKEDKEPLDDVPVWFVNFTHISLPSVTSDVSSGWNIIGTLTITGDTTTVYQSLYKMFIQLFYLFIIALSSSLIILSIMLKIILKPLKGVQKQAESIAKNEFILQEEIPYTQEFRDVVLGINSMVTKVKAMFDKGNEALKLQKKREYTDQTTQLKNRKYLINKLPEFLKIDSTSEGGIFMMIALSGMIEANEKIGHKKVDTLLKLFADVYKETVKEYKETIVARMNGTEFALFIPYCTSSIAISFAKSIIKKSQESIIKSNLNEKTTFLSIGIYAYNYQESIATVLSQADNALTQAKFNKESIHLATPKNITEVMGKDAWRKILIDAIENKKFLFLPWLVIDSQTKEIVHKVLSLTLKGDSTYYYGQFMAPANQTGLSNDIYTTALHILFKKTDKELHGSTCSLRLPYDFLVDSDTYDDLQTLLTTYARKLPFKLIIEIPDKFMSQERELTYKYQQLLEKFTIDLGIFEFIGESKDYQYLQKFRPLYIKAQSNYFLAQDDQGLSALRLITDSLGIQLIASGVTDEQTLKELQIKDIHVIQGSITELLPYYN